MKQWEQDFSILINCGHSVTPYFDEMKALPKKSAEERQADEELYDRKQKLNQINRQVRKWQERENAIRDIGSMEQKQKVKEKVNYWRSTSRQYASKHNLKNYNLPKRY